MLASTAQRIQIRFTLTGIYPFKCPYAIYADTVLMLPYKCNFSSLGLDACFNDYIHFIWDYLNTYKSPLDFTNLLTNYK